MCGGDQVSLDCNDPEGAVFTCVATNRATQQQAPLQQAAPQLPYPWEQLVDQNRCWSEVTPRLEGDSGPSARVTSLKAQGTLMHPGVQPTARQPQKAAHKCSLLRAASIKYEDTPLCTNRNGAVYYSNSQTGEAQWDPPQQGGYQ